MSQSDVCEQQSLLVFRDVVHHCEWLHDLWGALWNLNDIDHKLITDKLFIYTIDKDNLSVAVPCRAAQCEYSVACYYSSAVKGVQKSLNWKYAINTIFQKCFNHRISCSSPFSPTWPQDLVLHKTQSAVWWHLEGTSVDTKTRQLVKLLGIGFHSLTTTSSWAQV